MTFCFDIDQTILLTDYIDGTYVLIGVKESIVDSLIKLKNKGHIIVLHTGRHWNHLALTQKQLKQVGVPYDSLVMGKPVADFYIDDKGIGPDQFYNLFKTFLEENDG